MEPLIDSNEAAKLLRIHPKTLQQMARDRKLPAIRIGKFWRFRTSELDAFLRSGVDWPGYAYRPNKENL